MDVFINVSPFLYYLHKAAIKLEQRTHIALELQ